MKKQVKSALSVIALILLILSSSGCISILNTRAYPDTTFKVVDAETNQPIEGAVLLVQWTKPGPFFTTAATNYKVVEVQSDEKGVFAVPGAFRMGLNAPRLVVYKRGYVAWRNDFTFPGYERKTDFKWRNGYTIELEKFQHSRNVDLIDAHHSFITGGYSSGVPSNGLFKRALRGELGGQEGM